MNSTLYHCPLTVKPHVILTVNPQSSVFPGETVTLSCDVGQLTGWTIHWRKDSNPESTGGPTKTIKSVSVSDGGYYWCVAKQGYYYSEFSNAAGITVEDLPTSTLTVKPDSLVFTGETVNLKCVIESHSNWRYEWYKGKDSVMLQTSDHYTVNRDTLTIRGATKSDQDQYWCKGQRDERPKSSQSSSAVSLTVKNLPTSTLTVTPDSPVFTGETVNLKCVLQSHRNWRQRNGLTDDWRYNRRTAWTYDWRYEWYKGIDNVVLQTSDHYTVNRDTLTIRGATESDQDQYWCRGQRDKRPKSSHLSSAVSFTVTAEARAAVRVSPQPWLTEGDSVTLICEVTGSSTGWTFSWFRDDDHLSDSSRGAGGSYTLSPAALQHTGVYTCRAERGRPAYYTNYSNTQPLWITGVCPSVSLVVSPSRSQHFSSDSLSLSCEDQSNSTGWTVRRYTDRNTEDCLKQTGSTCRIISLSTSDTGVYWCQSESGEKHHPLNITVHDGDVILVSSVDPVIEGDTLTLHCLHRSSNSPILRADFYKDGSLIQNQTTGEMSITTVSKSHEGFYYCKTEKGQSLHSWISVRVSCSGQISVFNILIFLLVALPYLLSTVVLLFKCYRARVASTEDQSHVTEEQTSS
ncbi:Fc receptor-like protein 5 [Labeo rohita]|uniref:Fc receptor-like protein 5 n=1 Tax=Labeo rohita TaxID=84645 RepID=A0ABQ8L7V8_LABRO|nr:Fc receptor-like protein 5 [Labeo rohita]